MDTFLLMLVYSGGLIALNTFAPIPMFASTAIWFFLSLLKQSLLFVIGAYLLAMPISMLLVWGIIGTAYTANKVANKE